MSSILVINAAGRETRVALVENGHIAEFYLERKKDKGIVGNIYKGRVVRVLPGMQAAFVDIGLDKAAFLYVSDVVYDPDFAREAFELTEGEHEDTPEVPDEPETHPEGHAEPHLAENGENESAPEGASTTGEPVEASTHGERESEVPEADAADVSDVELEVEELPPGALSAPPDGVAVRRITGELEIAAALGGPSAASQSTPGDATAAAATAERSESGERTESGEHSRGERPTGGPAGNERARGERTGNEQPSSDRAPQEGRRGNREGNREGRDGNREGGQGQRGEKQRPRDQSERSRRRNPERRPNRTEEGTRKTVKIEDILKVGQEVVVQISKDPIGTKGARLTSHISIPGRHLVFMPTVDHVGISRRIGNERERRRLRDTVERLRPPGTGFIVRTVAETVPQEKLESDIRFLIGIWNQVVHRNEKRSGPGLIHPDLDLILRATRDLFAQDVEKLVVDDRDEYERILSFVTAQDTALRERVVLHEGEEPIFDAYGIEQEIQRAVQRKVWLKSGGYLIIDQAEALTAIDVNSGRYVGKKSLEETITKINMEAAKEIVYQLRLRNIGGIIICDFIDMEKQQNREKVFKTLQEALGRDKAKTNVLRISELGLVEMTRKRVRESIGRILHEDCAYCEGKGFVKTATTVAYQVFRDIRREAPNHKDPVLVISCNADVARLLAGEERLELRHLMDRYNKTIQVRAQPTYHREQYELYGRTAEGNDHRLASSAPQRRPGEGEGKERGSERGEERGKWGGRGGKDRGRDRGNDRRPSGGQAAPPDEEASSHEAAPALALGVGTGELKNP